MSLFYFCFPPFVFSPLGFLSYKEFFCAISSAPICRRYEKKNFPFFPAKEIYRSPHYFNDQDFNHQTRQNVSFMIQCCLVDWGKEEFYFFNWKKLGHGWRTGQLTGFGFISLSFSNTQYILVKAWTFSSVAKLKIPVPTHQNSEVQQLRAGINLQHRHDDQSEMRVVSLFRFFRTMLVILQ